MKYSRILVAAVAASSVVALVGCSSGNNSTSGSSASAVSKPVKVAAVLKTLGNPFWAAMEAGLKDQAKKTGVTVNVQAAPDEASADAQTTLAQTLAGGGYTCFIAAPITATNLVQPLVPVSNAGTPIVNLDSIIDPAAAKAANLKITTFVASNNQDAGKRAGDYMVKVLNGKGTVAVIGGLPGDQSSKDRTGGFTAAAKAGGLTILQNQNADWDAEKALNAATTILQAHPDLGGFYAANDVMAMGVEKAVQNANLKTKVIGTDGDKDALQSIAAGALTATVSQYPYAEGVLGIDACLAAAKGAKLPSNVDAPISLITPENAAESVKSYPHPVTAVTNPFEALLKK